MSTPARSYPKRSRQSAIPNYSSTSNRRPRRSAGLSRSGTGTTENNHGLVGQKWTKVRRAPSAPLDAPYFGCSASAPFEIPMWVRVEELTTEERARYDKEEKKREAQRVIWRKELARKRREKDASKKGGKEDGEEKVNDSDVVDEGEGSAGENMTLDLTQDEGEGTEDAERSKKGVTKKNVKISNEDVALKEYLTPESPQSNKKT